MQLNEALNFYYQWYRYIIVMMLIASEVTEFYRSILSNCDVQFDFLWIKWENWLIVSENDF